MSKTLALRKLIAEMLRTSQGEVHHRKASKDATYPYKTYELSSVTFTDCNRDDFELCVDLWDRAGDSKTIEALADEVEQLFNNVNLPQDTILPTFFRENRYFIEDPDKTLDHIQLRFSVQLYEIKKEE